MIKRLLLGTVLFFLSCIASADTDTFSVLILQGANRAHYWTREQLEGIEKTLSTYQQPIDLHVEYLDLYRFTDKRYRQNLARLLLAKYSSGQTNLRGIITTSDEAFQFLLEELAPLGKGLPVVSTGAYGFTDDLLRLARKRFQWTGIRYDQAFVETVIAALKIHQKARRIFVLHDSSMTASSQFREFKAGIQGRIPNSVEVHELGLGTFEETARVLESLKEGDLIFRLRYYVDSRGRGMGFEQSMRFMRDHSKVPIYSCWEGLLGLGIVGGKLSTGRDVGQVAASHLLEMMNGKVDPSEPVRVVKMAKFIFDDNEMKRFGIDRSLLPPDSIIINRPLSIYEQHPVLSWAVFGTIFVLSGLLLVSVKAKFKAEEANLAKTRFLANVSHEIRTPLTAIMSYADFLESDDVSEVQQREFIDKIRTNGTLVTNLVNDILDLSSAEFGHVRIDKAGLSTERFFADLMAEAKALASNHGLTLEIGSQGPIPREIATDAMRLRQVLMNLIGNSVKFTSSGSITLMVSFEREGGMDRGSDGTLKIDVTDTGVGIALADANGLFAPFRQLDSSMTRRYGGTGLGLALSRDLARALGGDVVLARSEKGRGSTFTVTIDAGKTQGEWIIDKSFPQAHEPSEAKRAKEALPRLDHAKILVAEDSPENQAIIKRYLSKVGAEVEVANDGAEALEMARRGSFDIVLMDIQMPVLDGIEATIRLRALGFKKPILALTAHALKEQRDRSLAVGCNEHLTKPISKEVLIETIARFLKATASDVPALRS